MKCYYEVLNINRDAENNEIKNAYRKLALRWHPDKNLNNPDEAKEQFQLVQNAYEVLSDPQERAWYDSHREQLLKGVGTSFNDESLDLIAFFTPSCYKGFGDDEKGFYSVYREVFKKLAAEEVDYLDDPEDVSSIPMFGDSTVEYEKVHEFYAYWMSFSTSKSFVWLDKYDIREADNRKVLKLLEKENNKIRQKARKERNDEIRQLVTFVRRRDKRVQAYNKLLQERAEENKKKAEQLRKDKLIQRQKELEEAKKRQSDVQLYSMNDFHEQLDQIEKHLAEEFGHSDEETLTGPSDNEDVDYQNSQNSDENMDVIDEQTSKEKYSASQSLYCTACNKLFKNIKSFENHENSKKHKENVMNLKLDTELDISDEELVSNTAMGQEENCNDSDEEISDEPPVMNLLAESKKKKKNKKKVINPHEFDSEHIDSLESIEDFSRSRRARKAKNLEKSTVKIKDPVIPPVNGVVPDSVDISKEESTVLTNGNNVIGNDDEKLDIICKEEDVEIESPVENNKPKYEKKQPINKGKEKKYSQKQKNQIAEQLDIADIDTAHCCAICKANFPSKNKLFDHLKKTGHQIYLPTSQAASKPPKKKATKIR